MRAWQKFGDPWREDPGCYLADAEIASFDSKVEEDWAGPGKYWAITFGGKSCQNPFTRPAAVREKSVTQ